MQDWNYIWTQTFELTLEVSDIKWPPKEQLEQFWQENKPALLALLKHAHVGVHGQITNESGDPILARVEVVGIDHPVFTDPTTGMFYRLLTPGQYILNIFAEGYDPITHTIIIPPTDPQQSSIKQATILNASLFKTPPPPPSTSFIALSVGLAVVGVAVCAILVYTIYSRRLSHKSNVASQNYRIVGEEVVDSVPLRVRIE
mmetsp:Transcript_21426/g.35456  ORF Transcript_21426/g.35456 Transcript_21426/m.35456 type:complete len:201 (+) Transcript_21426:460-1062(+)